MIVAIPSKGRAGRVASLDVIPHAVLFVPEGEVEEYRHAHGGTTVVGVPTRVRGITATRNWILEDVDDPRVVFVDDDVKIHGWIELFETNGKHRTMTEAEWWGTWQRLFDVTEGAGLRIWGTATDGALRSVYPYRPFIFHTYVTASCMGILRDSGIRFDESFPVKEDYEMCLRCLKEDGGVVGARYVYWANAHWDGPARGGCGSYRTQAMEDQAIQRLMEMYPGLIRRVTRGGAQYSIELDF